MQTDELNKLLDKLIQLGENKEEMEHWRKIYQYMTGEEKKQLEDNLIKTLEIRKT